MSSMAEHTQKAPRTFFSGWNLRASSMPIEKGNNIRSRPPRKFCPSSVQPTPIIP